MVWLSHFQALLFKAHHMFTGLSLIIVNVYYIFNLSSIGNSLTDLFSQSSEVDKDKVKRIGKAGCVYWKCR